jgi:hypothetical protein
MRVVILQPGYLPWLGFFDQMYKSDVFIIYDDVQFDKNGWRNRNRIKTSQGWQWLSVPVLLKGRNFPIIKDVIINNNENWRKRHLESIRQNYSKAPFFNLYFGLFEDIFSKEWRYLLELDMAFIYNLSDKLNIIREIKFSSELNVKGGQTDRLLNICIKFGANHYLTGDAAKDYMDESIFQKNNIKLEFHNYKHPIYEQRFGEFIPYLSVIDLMFNHGDKSLDILTNKRGTETEKNL